MSIRFQYCNTCENRKVAEAGGGYRCAKGNPPTNDDGECVRYQRVKPNPPITEPMVSVPRAALELMVAAARGECDIGYDTWQKAVADVEVALRGSE